jgi:hypothetical protein
MRKKMNPARALFQKIILLCSFPFIFHRYLPKWSKFFDKKSLHFLHRRVFKNPIPLALMMLFIVSLGSLIYQLFFIDQWAVLKDEDWGRMVGISLIAGFISFAFVLSISGYYLNLRSKIIFLNEEVVKPKKMSNSLKYPLIIAGVIAVAFFLYGMYQDIYIDQVSSNFYSICYLALHALALGVLCFCFAFSTALFIKRFP